MLNKSLFLLFCIAYLTAAAGPTTYTFKTVGDLQIQLDVHTPSTSAPATGYPVFFTIHGGAYIEGSKSGGVTKQERTEALNRGWVVISIGYRLMPGAVLDDILEDVQDAYNWVRTELIKYTHINPDLITVFGKSAGGGLAVLGGYKLSPRPRVVVGFFSGLTNWTDPKIYNPNTPVDPLLVAAANKLSVPVVVEYTRTGNTDPKVLLMYAAEKAGKAGWLAVTHDPSVPKEKIIAKLKDFSATENVDGNYPPTYLAHGTADTVVPYLQSVQLADQLKQKNIPYVLDLVPGAGHSFDNNPDLWEQHVLPAFEFAAKYMQSSKTEMSFFEKWFQL